MANPFSLGIHRYAKLVPKQGGNKDTLCLACGCIFGVAMNHRSFPMSVAAMALSACQLRNRGCLKLGRSPPPHKLRCSLWFPLNQPHNGTLNNKNKHRILKGGEVLDVLWVWFHPCRMAKGATHLGKYGSRASFCDTNEIPFNVSK